MRQDLAERLLIEVMKWTPEDVASERPILEAMAEYKYDEYQQFSPGMRFVENLAIWLTNFDMGDRQIAYDFIMRRLIYISSIEMRHLVSITYPHFIRPILIKEAAKLIGIDEYKISRIVNSDKFKALCRRSLFLGLSDGAHIDIFRRVSNLNNEQVSVEYRLDHEVAEGLRKDLVKDLNAFPDLFNEGNSTFSMIFLLNDFSGSSDTLIRPANVEGKIKRAMDHIESLQKSKPPVIDPSETKVFIILYIATEDAVSNLVDRIKLFAQPSWPKCEVKPIHLLTNDIKVTALKDVDFDPLLTKYYDPSIMTEHLKKGGDNVIHGYADCSLPLVLSHNTPNNSIYLLWSDLEKPRTQGLFPRVSRHKGDMK
jgi:hypothetical protein